MILRYFPELEPDDLVVTSSGSTGEDLQLSPKARRLLPFTFENKNVERLNVWIAWRQAVDHAKKRKDKVRPLLVFKRNNQELLVALRLDDFLSLYSSGGVEPHLSNLANPGASNEE